MAHSDEFRTKMSEAGLAPAFSEGWIALYEKFCAGDKGFIPEESLEPVVDLPELGSLPDGDESLLGRTVVLKLNGGLGTGMGLDKAKSLLKVKDNDTFLDLIAKQILQLRKKFPVRFMLMNSFSTEEDTKEFFKKYPEIHDVWESEVAFQQNMSPKVDAETKRPVSWPEKPSCEWCPPGHGDIYAALLVSGQLDKLIAEGYEYMFVSNSDNLGATMDLRLLGHLASSGAPMLMEVCVRGENDKKGGHLAREKATGTLTLRESAQCPKEDEKAFQDITKHKYFNTNNLWLNLIHLRNAMSSGVLPLPLIMNEKRVDPASKENPGPKVYQLETAMGAAISALRGSEAICVPFDRFAPVKTCNQLFGLRSDAYVISPEFTPVLAKGACKPVIVFDDSLKMVPDMEATIPNGVPSLRKCQKLTVKGKVVFARGTIIEGDVEIHAGQQERPPTVSGHIRGSKDKLRILRDADDTQNHSSGVYVAPAGTVTMPAVRTMPMTAAPVMPMMGTASGAGPLVHRMPPGSALLSATARTFPSPVATVGAQPRVLNVGTAHVPMPQIVQATVPGGSIAGPRQVAVAGYGAQGQQGPVRIVVPRTAAVASASPGK